MTVVTILQHFSYNICRSQYLEKECFICPSHLNSLSILELVPLNCPSPHLHLYPSMSDRQKVYDSRMWYHTSYDIFNHTKKCHVFFRSLFPPRGHLVLHPQRPREKFDTQMRSFKLYPFFLQSHVNLFLLPWKALDVILYSSAPNIYKRHLLSFVIKRFLTYHHFHLCMDVM